MMGCVVQSRQPHKPRNLDLPEIRYVRQGAESLKSQSSKSEVRSKLRNIRRTDAFKRRPTRGRVGFGNSVIRNCFELRYSGCGLRSEEGKRLTSSAERRMERSELP